MDSHLVTGELGEIVIGQTGLAEIMQNVRIILTTIKGSVPLDRSFGIDTEFIDKPPLVAKALMTAAIIEEVERQEPRVTVTQVDFVDPGNEKTADGILVPRVRLKVKEGML